MWCSRPRPRGGLPRERTVRVPAALPSPPTRGSSGEGDRVFGLAQVVPAHAGVFPGPGRGRRRPQRRPRPRGDLPDGWRPEITLPPSSPPTRGSSLGHAEGVAVVVPAHAGVFVGNPSARVRDRLWAVLSQRVGDGQAVMIEPAGNEQGWAVRTAGRDRGYPVDYDGLILFARPRR